MAKNTIWLVGVVGSGRTTVAVALAAFYCRRPGIVCALSTEFGAVYRFDACAGDFADDAHDPALLTDADFMFVEVQPSRFNLSALRPGDQIVRTERVPGGCPQAPDALTLMMCEGWAERGLISKDEITALENRSACRSGTHP